MQNESVVNLLQKLVENCRDGQNGYRDAAEDVTDTNLRHFFNEQSLARAGFAGELEQEIVKLGYPNPDRSGSAAAGIRRAWIDFKTGLGAGDVSILSSVEAGEDSAKASYEKALEQAELPEQIAALIRRQLASISAAHDHVRSLRDAKAA
jgi:uncharacterized protein (TIGR02284 family)